MNITLKSLAIIFILISAGVSLNAQIRTFTGLDQQNPHKWNEDDNWDNGNVPSSGDTVLVDSDSVSITTIDPELYSLDLRNGAVVLNQRQLTFSNGDTFAIKLTQSTIRNEGQIYVDDAGDESSDFAVQIGSQSKLINDGLVYMEDSEAGGILVVNGLVVNNGTIHVDVFHTAIHITGSFSDFINRDSMYLHSSAQTALRLESGGLLTNEEFGIVCGIANFSSSLYCINSDLINYGKLNLSSGGRALFLRSNSSFLHHSGTLGLESSSSSGTLPMLVIEADGFVKVFEGAKLEITSDLDSRNYFELEEGGLLDCEGEIEMFDISN